jgi:hypothetical protein
VCPIGVRGLQHKRKLLPKRDEPWKILEYSRRNLQRVGLAERALRYNVAFPHRHLIRSGSNAAISRGLPTMKALGRLENYMRKEKAKGKYNRQRLECSSIISPYSRLQYNKATFTLLRLPSLCQTPPRARTALTLL